MARPLPLCTAIECAGSLKRGSVYSAARTTPPCWMKWCKWHTRKDAAQAARFVENQVQERGFSTPSEYIRSLGREDQKRRAKEKLEALLLEGLNSGHPLRSPPHIGKRSE